LKTKDLIAEAISLPVEERAIVVEIKPTSILLYISISLIGSLFVRIVNSYFREREADKGYRPLFLKILKGHGYREDILKPPIAADYLLGFFLGFIELLAYPILLKSNHAAYIGAWLAFKTAHRWGYSSEYKRGTFNRYLFANALILFISYFMAKFLLILKGL